MTYRVVVQPQAERDIQTRALWILEQSQSWARALRWARTDQGGQEPNQDFV